MEYASDCIVAPVYDSGNLRHTEPLERQEHHLITQTGLGMPSVVVTAEQLGVALRADGRNRDTGRQNNTPRASYLP